MAKKISELPIAETLGNNDVFVINHIESGVTVTASVRADIVADGLGVDNKVDKVAGKGLSTNDYDDTDKDIVDGVTEALAGKQDTISDLSTIRSGASAGATAYQKPSGGIPKTDLASAVQTSLEKADSALQSHQPAVRYDTASQGLTDTQKSNARTNIGAGTSSFSGSYNDLTNKPTIPSAQVNSDWNATSGVAQILNKPTIPDVSGKADKVSGATSGNVATLNASGNLVDSGKTLGKTVPSDAVFTDTKNTAGSTDTSSKIYLIGATSQAANPQTYSQDTAYVGTDGCLYSGGTKVLTSHQSIAGKADKVSGATNGNVATLDANGNLVDSGKTIGKSVPNDAVFTDTKNTAGSTDSSSKLFLIGATSQAANPQTYSHDTAYVGTDGCLYSGGTKVLTAHQSITGKADKVSGATSGNFAGLDANGNLTDSGKKPGDILTLGTSSSTAYRGDRGNTAYTHATETRLTTATAQGLYKVGSTAQGHISGLTAVAKSDITALGIPAQDTTYESKSASSGGTAVSLCTTGEKYTWNNKQNALSSMSQSEADTGTSKTGRIITAKVLTDTIHTKSHTLYGATKLLSIANLNSLTAPIYSGEYYYPIHGHSITNLPTGATGKPFRLVVESLSDKDANLATGTGDLDYSSANCTLQTLIVSDIAGTPSVKTYRRHYLNSTWSAWYSYEDEIESLNSRLVDSLTNRINDIDGIIDVLFTKTLLYEKINTMGKQNVPVYSTYKFLQTIVYDSNDKELVESIGLNNSAEGYIYYGRQKMNLYVQAYRISSTQVYFGPQYNTGFPADGKYTVYGLNLRT